MRQQAECEAAHGEWRERGAMQVNGMNVKLIGEANDYVGKGMAGGDITIVPPPDQNIDVSTPFHHQLCRAQVGA